MKSFEMVTFNKEKGKVYIYKKFRRPVNILTFDRVPIPFGSTETLY